MKARRGAKRQRPRTLYRYRSLEGLPEGTIRLLKIQPGSYDSDLRAQLTAVPLDHCPKYRALSYTWGDEKDFKSVFIGRRCLRVRENLWHFLRRLRQENETSYLWADAICVNQQDVPERTSQVQLMGRIYSEAEIVFAWLGDDLSGNKLDDHERSILLSHESGVRPSLNIDIGTIVQIWETIMSILGRSYWIRTWIIQEVVLARDIIFFYGLEAPLPWQRLVKLAYSLAFDSDEVLAEAPANLWPKIIGWKNSLNETHWGAMNSLKALRSEYRRRDDPKFLEFQARMVNLELYFKKDAVTHARIDNSLKTLLGQFSSTSCSDPRDKVYALIGLATDRPIQADYAMPRAVLFWELVSLDMTDSQFAFLLLTKVFPLTVREVKTLIICLVGLHQLPGRVVRLINWLRYAQGLDDFTYDEDVIDWLRCPRAIFDDIVDCVVYHEKDAAKVEMPRLKMDAFRKDHQDRTKQANASSQADKKAFDFALVLDNRNTPIAHSDPREGTDRTILILGFLAGLMAWKERTDPKVLRHSIHDSTSSQIL